MNKTESNSLNLLIDYTSAVARALGYLAILAMSMWTAGRYFNDTYFANMALFFFGSLSVELVSRAPIAEHPLDMRRVFYVLCVIGLLFSGVTLTFLLESVR
jgi:predicted Abi (CAAX) family protease